jgi:sodium/hydrogen antiporter
VRIEAPLTVVAEVATAPGLDPGGAFQIEVLFAGLVVLVAVAALTREHERPFSAAIAYLLLGAVAALGARELNVPLIDPFDEANIVEHLAAFALIAALFGTGLRLNIEDQQLSSALVLLLVVMPATIGLIAAFGVVAMGLSAGAALILGAILAPTDPVLAGEVGARPPGQESEGARFHLSAEAGANDALAAPYLLLGLLIIEGGTGPAIAEWIAFDVFYACGLAAIMGIAGGKALAWATVKLHRREFVAGELDIFFAFGSMLLLYGAAALLDAYGFLAVFLAGVGFRRYETKEGRDERVHRGARIAENVLEIAIVFVLGTFLGSAAFNDPGLAGWLLAPLIFIAFRPPLVALGLRQFGVPLRKRLFIGWFGVKGVASVYYAAFVLEQHVLSPADEMTVFWTVTIVIAVSVVVHGITATPLTSRTFRPNG